MTLRLTRTTHGARTASATLEIDGDRASCAQASGQRVGRFARSLSTRERRALDRALAAAASAEPPAPPAGPFRPSGTVEQLIGDGLPELVLDSAATPPGAFKDLLRLLFRLRENLGESPVAVIELEVAGTPPGARLRHLGSDPIRLRISTLTLTTTLFGPDSAIVDTSSEVVEASAVDGQVGPGWAIPLVSDLGVAAPAKGGFLTVTVGTAEVDALGDGVLRPAVLSWMSE